MEIVYLLLPLAVLLAGVIAWIFFWAVRSGQFDDLEGPAHRILMDEAEDAPIQISGRTSEASRASITARGSRLDFGTESRATVQGRAGSSFDPIGDKEPPAGNRDDKSS
jgi:cbb3-type cytochrome oxidase maturation protein